MQTIRGSDGATRRMNFAITEIESLSEVLGHSGVCASTTKKSGNSKSIAVKILILAVRPELTKLEP
jgi:hypothetical protein